ncbi:MAG: acetate/propionate family kinase [Dongiaceae bacterium]
MALRLLVLNAGSSSLKFGVYDAAPAADPALVCRGQIAGIGLASACSAVAASGEPLDFAAGASAIVDHKTALRHLLSWLAGGGQGTRFAGAGHRVVHGGTMFSAHRRLTPSIIDDLAALAPLAPHHQPHNIAAIRALAEVMPELPQVACFDTAFHAGQPAEARVMSLPRRFAEAGVLRYGFHGLSYEYVVDRLRRLGGGRLPDRLVIAHLGNGASLCAVESGRGIATTMGFSTLDGLIMGTRVGAVDPGVIIHLLRQGIDVAAIEDLLYNQSGLLGLSGESSDMKSLLASGSAAAHGAISHYCYQINRQLGSLAAALGGLDALVFAGGIGEHAAPVRAQVCALAGWLGIELDDRANAAGEGVITRPGSRVVVRIVPTNEELVIARHTRRLIDT